MYNHVTLVGRLGDTPEFREVNGQSFARFRLATNEKWTTKTGDRQERTEWHTVELWGRKAEVAGQYLGKGSLVLIEGKITYQKSNKETPPDQKPQWYTVIRADNFQMLDSKE